MRKLGLIAFLLALALVACEQDDDARCDDLTCFNGGTCVDGICDCPPGFTGFNCETQDPCDTVVCQNSGTCVDGTCACPTGFSGVACEEFDPCADLNCENGGECIDGVCQCEPNYTGVNCENQIPPTSITITNIVVSSFPKIKSNGAPWDANNGPDLIPEISRDGEVFFTTEDALVNTNNGEVVSWMPDIVMVLEDYQSIHTFTLFDGDPGDTREEMGKVFFTPYTSQNDFPSELELTADSIRLRVDLEYVW